MCRKVRFSGIDYSGRNPISHIQYNIAMFLCISLLCMSMRSRMARLYTVTIKVFKCKANWYNYCVCIVFFIPGRFGTETSCCLQLVKNSANVQLGNYQNNTKKYFLFQVSWKLQVYSYCILTSLILFYYYFLWISIFYHSLCINSL